MRRISKLLVLFLLVAITACSAPKPTRTSPPVTAAPILSRQQYLANSLTLTLETKTKFDAETIISDENYDKYNTIMDYLYANSSVSEDVLYKELEVILNESAEELQAFVSANMAAAIDRNLSGGDLTESDILDLTQLFFEKNMIVDAGSWKLDRNGADVSITGRRALATVTFYVYEQPHKAIVKYEFSSDYKMADVFQLKIDGENIDSVTDNR